MFFIDKNSYKSVPINQFGVHLPNNNGSIVPIAPPNDNVVLPGNPKYNPAVAGGFTALGLCIGFLVWLTLWCFKRQFRSKEKSQSREMKYNSRDCKYYTLDSLEYGTDMLFHQQKKLLEMIQLQ